MNSEHVSPSIMTIIPSSKWERFLIWLFPRQYSRDYELEAEIRFIPMHLADIYQEGYDKLRS